MSHGASGAILGSRRNARAASSLAALLLALTACAIARGALRAEA